MRLSDYTDYTLRVLMYCATHPDRLVTIAEIADRHQVSKNHLMKIVNSLARQGVLDTTRGRGGGVVREAETDFRLVECFDPGSDTCTLTPDCRLKGVLGKALKAYFAELDSVTLADIAGPPGRASVRPASRAKPSAGAAKTTATVGRKAPRKVIRMLALKP